MGKLRGFYGGLPSPAERAMLECILEGAQGGETGGFRVMRRRYEDAAEAVRRAPPSPPRAGTT